MMAAGPARSADVKSPKKELNPEQIALRDRVRRTVTAVRQQPFNTRDNTVGNVLHFCQAFGCDTEIYDPAQGNEKINGITCLCWNVACGGSEALTFCEGHLAARIGFGYQEIPAQMAAMLALSRVPASYPARANGNVRTVADLIEYEKLSCRTAADMSLKLVALAYYVQQPTWHNSLGEEWSLERVVRSELARPVGNTPHGATTRLLGLSYALDHAAHRGKTVQGDFQRAKQFVLDSIDYALRTQNSDGSWGRNANRDYASALSFTGHVLEWLALTLPEDRLEDPRIVTSISYLDGLLSSQRYQGGVQAFSAREISAVMHSTHALAIYDQRVFVPANVPPPPPPPEKPKEVAAQ